MPATRSKLTRTVPLALACAGAAFLVPATAQSAVFGVQDDRMTIAEPIENLGERLKMVRATRSKVARFDILWSEVATERPRKMRDHRDPAYDWTRADRIIRGLSGAGITPIISVYSTPRWAEYGDHIPHESQYNPTAPRPVMYAAFMQAVADRYAGRARHFEVWNEPNLKGFFDLNGRASIGHYKKVVRAAGPAIKRGNRRAIVIAGVGGPRSSTGNGNIGARPWMYSLVRDKRVRFNAYSQHIYPSRGPRFLNRSYARAFPTWHSVREMHRLLARERRGMKLYITEAGYTTAETPFRNVKVSPRQQNLYLRQMANLPAVRSPRTAAVIWFNLEDNVNWPAGLRYEGGEVKPSHRSFRRIASRPIPRALRGELNRKLEG